MSLYYAILNKTYTHSDWPSDEPGTPVRFPRTGIYLCPVYNRMRGVCMAVSRGADDVFPVAGSYGYNAGGTHGGGRGLIGGYHSWVGGSAQTFEYQVLAPSDMIAMGEAVIIPYQVPAIEGDPELSWPFIEAREYKAVMYGVPAGNAAVQAMKRRHGGRWNIAFCDAHVETLRAPQLFYISDPVIARRWNADHQPHIENWVPPPP